MKIPYFCCIGAELKRYEKDFDFMNQVYLYKIPADDTLEEVLAQDYFLAIADTVLQDDLLYIYESTAQVLHTCRFNKQAGHITAVQLSNNVPGLTPNRVLISDSTGHIAAGDVTLEYLKNKVNLDGTSIMTGPLKFRAGSFSGAIAGGLGDGVSVYKIKADGTIDSEVASLTKTNGFTPGTTNAQNIGSPTLKWKDAHVARVITGIINNGYDIAVPVTSSADTLALKSEVDNAANSGRMITAEGVWFAKMYAASVVPTGAEYDGKNYADFSQTDGDGNPVIKIYTGASGAWTLTDTITPPANYDGYVPVTKKIWDILDQTGQQGGRILWNHQSKTFTPFPQMVSFEDAALTGTPTAPTPTDESPLNQIATKEYVDNANPTGTYHPGIFAHEWDDHIRNDISWLRADTFSWQAAVVYKAAYKALFDDIYEYTVWTAAGESDVRTKTYTPAVGDEVYLDSSPDTVVGTVTAFDELNNQISVSDGNTYTFSNNTFVTPVSETVAGHTLSVYIGHTGKKIVTATDETKVASIYMATGTAWYYVIDITNKRFKLPRKHSTQVVRSYQSGTSWYKLYADGYVEQGGYFARNTAEQNTVTFTIPFADKNYSVDVCGDWNGNTAQACSVNWTAATTTQCIILKDGTGMGVFWTARGYSNIDMSQFQADQKHLYFYVGDFTQTAIENTAGINAELFNDKVDIGHQVIAFQAPTAGNNYTWYRKYADGWVEQGGKKADEVDTVVTLPITMADTEYCITLCSFAYNDDHASIINVKDNTKTTTGFTIQVHDYNNGSFGRPGWWEVKGMAAQ